VVSATPVLENATNYFLEGTFDPLDLLAIVFGALAAYLTLILVLGSEYQS
jgi:hypothetical protein